MKHTPQIVYEKGIAVPARCYGCPKVQAIVSAALESARPLQHSQRETIQQSGLTDLSTGQIWLSPDGASRLADRLKPISMQLETITQQAQADVDNLTRNCPGGVH